MSDLTYFFALAFTTFLVGYLCSIGLDLLIQLRKPKSLKVTRFERYGKHDYKLFLSNGLIVVGSVTVWHYFPSGRRCNTPLESLLSNEMKRLELEGKLKK